MSNYALYQMDAVEWLQGFADSSIHLVCTDPAYESLEKHRARGTTTRLTSEWFDIFPNARFPELFAECYRVLKRDSHMYLMCDSDTMFVAREAGIAAGFTFYRPLVWHKVNLGMGYLHRRRCEFILFFGKGERALTNPYTSKDVLDVEPLVEPQDMDDEILVEASLRGKRAQYPTQKPVPLAEYLVVQSSSPGQIVADPFMGSGFVGQAALRNDRRFLGNDLSPRAVALAQELLAAVPQEGRQNPRSEADGE